MKIEECRMRNGEARHDSGSSAKYGNNFSILYYSFSILGASFRLPHRSPSASWPKHREKCGLNGFYVLKGITAGEAVVNHAAARRAEGAVQAGVLRVAERAGDCLVARPLQLYKLTARHGHAVGAKPLPAGGRNAISPPGRVENMLNFDFVDFRQSADGLDDLLVDHLQRRAPCESGRDENTRLATADFDTFDNAQVNDADRHLGIVDVREDRPDALLSRGLRCRILHDPIIAHAAKRQAIGSVARSGLAVWQPV